MGSLNSVFSFDGEVASSKSLMNRALIAASYKPELKIIGFSDCDDVRLMRQGILDLFQGRPVNCGHAGTVLRFLAVRASRLPGRHVITGSERLLSRPQEELLPIFGQLGVDSELFPNRLGVYSKGWRLIVDGLQINAQRSSQFASAVILNAWGLKFPLHFHVSRRVVSEGYLRMTIEVVRRLGMRIEDRGAEFFIPANQEVTASEYRVEPDVSSVFAVAALAVVAGQARVRGFPIKSLQPDAVFVRILKEMGALIRLEPQAGSQDQWGDLLVKKSPRLCGVNVNIEKSPDLLPVLGVLCALADSPSRIEGVGHLQFKESSRVEKTRELLELMGARVTTTESSVTIEPQAGVRSTSAVVYDVDLDHRMAMAATVARSAGFEIHPSDMGVVTKSFPEFRELAQGLSL
jgi:3-phosphoshikimate 1-carboxyvinyltransferase